MIEKNLAFKLLATAALITGATHLYGQSDTWLGASATTSNWSDGANWNTGNMFTTVPSNGDALTFQGSNRTTNNNDLDREDWDSITFAANAASFTLQGFNVGIAANGITNNSTNLQTISFSTLNPGLPTFTGVEILDNQTWNAAAGPLSITSNVQANRTNVTGPVTLTITGGFNTSVSGIMRDDPADATNILLLVKNGAGALTLSNSNTYTGGTTINAGTFVVANNNALGMASATMQPNNLHLTGGTLQTDVPRTFNVPGNYFQTGGTLRLQIGSLMPGVNNDFMLVRNDVNLGGSLFIHQFGGFMPTNGDRVRIIVAGAVPLQMGSVNGTFASFADDFPGRIQAVPDYFSDHVDIVFTIVPFSSLSGLTPNQREVAAELDEASNDPRAAALINFLGTEPNNALPHDFDLIAPEELAAIYEIGFSQAVVHNNNLMRRMDDIRAGSNGYCGPVVQTMPSGKDYAPPIQDKNVAIPDKNVMTPAFVPCPENHWGVFVTGSGDFVNVGDEDENARGYDIATGSVTVGVDYRLGDHIALGIDGTYDNSRADLIDNGKIDMDGEKIGGYATIFGKGFFGSKIYVEGAVDGGWNNYDTRRTGLDKVTIGIPYDDTARGTTDGSEFNALVAYGSDWTFGCFNIGTWSSLQYTKIDINGFTEHGSFAPLEFPDQDEDSFRATTGIRASYDAHFGKCGIVRPELRAAWLHEYNDRAYPIDSRFASGAGDIFQVRGPSIGRDAALVGAGVNVQWNPRVSTYVYYDGVLGRGNYDSNAVSAGLRVSF